MPQQQDPPPDHMIRELPTPDHSAGFYSELVKRTSPRFQANQPIKRGTLYSNLVGADQKVIDTFGTLFFLHEEVPLGGSDIRGMKQSNFVIWFWATSPDAESSFNSEVTYLAEDINYPAFQRVFTIRRSVYETTPALATGANPFTGLIGIKITAAGTGYTSAPTVAISGGNGATAEAVLNGSGGISHVIITAEGSGYDSASLPTISFSGGAGSGATATAIVQPKTALLASQKKSEFPDSSPWAAEFVAVTRIYRTRPGPPLIDKSVGIENQTPAEFRGQTQTVTTITDPIDPATALPSLSGDTVFVRIKGNSVAEATKFSTDEIIDVAAPPRVGQRTGEYGIDTISRSYVAEGTNADSGFGVEESSVLPAAPPGKAIKQTIRYPNAGVAEVLITTQGTGYTNGTYALGFTGGTGSGAAGTYTVTGNKVVRASITALGIYTALPTPTFPSGGGTGAVGLALEGHPAKISRLYDEDMQITYPRSEQIIQVVTDAQALLLQAQAQSGELKEIIGIDIWHSKLIKTTKVPTAVDITTAILSTATRPFAFPGLLKDDAEHPRYFPPVIFSEGIVFPGHIKKARADLVKVNIFTYWVTATTKPNIAIDEIITDSMLIPCFAANFSETFVVYREFQGLLHDEVTFDLEYNLGSITDTITYPATTPTYSTYIASWLGNEKIIAATVTPEKQKNLWKVQLERCVMQ